MKRKLISALLAVSMLMTLLPSAAFAAGLPFTDVAANAWYRDAVEYVYENDIMSGTGQGIFSPDTYLTRAQLCRLLYNMEGTPKGAGSAFDDVEKNAWYYDAVSWASEQGIVTGVGDNRFDPNSYVTREQMATILYRYSAAKGYDTEDLVDISEFADADSVSDWAKVGVRWAVGEGLIRGVTDTSLSPKGMSSRAVAATVIMRFRQRNEAIRAFEAKNVDDFRGYEVINFDESDETNFAVLTEDAVVSETDGSVNRLVSCDEENGVFVFSDIDEKISGLSEGDILYITYGSGEDDYLLLKVGDIRIDGTTATVTEGDAELSDYFTYIDVDMEVGVTEEDFDPSGADSGVDYKGGTARTAAFGGKSAPGGFADARRAAPLARGKAGGDISTDLKFGVDTGNISATADIKLTLTVKIRYDRSIFDIEEIKICTKQENKIELSLEGDAAGKEDTKEWSLGEAKVPIVPGVDAEVEVSIAFDFDLKGSFSGTVETTAEKGIKFINGEAKKIDESDGTFSVKAEGDLNVSLGVGVKLDLVALKLLRGSLKAEGGIELDGKAERPLYSTDKSEQHICALCVDGSVNLYGRVSAALKLGFSEKRSYKLVDVKFPEAKAHLAEFYVSFLNEESDMEFGFGDCPHKKYLVTVTVLDSHGKRVEGAEITLSDAETGNIAYSGTTNSNGVYEEYCENGTYTVLALGPDGYDVSEAKSVTVKEKETSVEVTTPNREIGGEIIVSTVEELRNAIGSDRTVILQGGTYELGWDFLMISNVENLTIRGAENAELLGSDEDDVILYISGSKNVRIENLTMGHHSLEFVCEAGVVYLDGSEDITIKNCDIYGCGMTGISGANSEFAAEDTTIRDCSQSIMYLYECEGTFTGCTFSGNGYNQMWEGPAIEMTDSAVSLKNCTLTNNKNAVYVGDSSGDASRTGFTESGCTYKNNGWE